MAKKQSGTGRPTKLTKKFLEVAEEVINEYILACTDSEIMDEINDRLEEEERICQSTWEKWKAGKTSNDEDGGKFLRLIKKALTVEKRNLLNKLKGDTGAWQRWAWIIERKFDEWNLKKKVDQKSEVEVKGVQVFLPKENEI